MASESHDETHGTVPTSGVRSGVRRRVPRWGEVRELLGFRAPRLRRTDRVLARAACVADLREAARRRVPRAVFDYTDGAAETEASLGRARRAFERVELRARVLRDVSEVSLGGEVLGRPAAMPLVFAPTGFTRMMHHVGEPAVARVAQRVGIPYALSTLGTTSPEDLAAAAPGADLWFQLYVWRDRGAAKELVERVAAAGFRVLVLTVDSPVAGLRLRDVRNGLTVPPQLSLRSFVDMAAHPWWWMNVVSTEPLRFASLSHWDGTVAELMDKTLDPTMDLEGLAWLREQWDGPILVKGVQHPDDAVAVLGAGADGVILSNHGGRQLDRAPAPLEVLPRVREAVGADAQVLVDGGILSGSDVVAAVALGASACLVGRAYLYGLMAGGEQGVARAAGFLEAEMRRTMALLGARTVAELSPDMATLRSATT